MNRTPRFLTGLALAATLAFTAQAASVHLADIVAAPSGVMDFEDAPDLFNGAIGRNTNGIRIQQLNSDGGNDIWSASGLGNGRSWYPDAGDNGWTRIRLVGGANFEALSFFGGSGWITPPQSLYFELADDGVVVLSGTLAATFTGSWFGFAGGDFDEVRLRASQGQVMGLFDCPSGGAGGVNSSCNFAWLDDIRVGAAVLLPLPSTAWLALLALLAAAISTRRQGAGLAAVAALAVATGAQAALINRGGGMVYDDVLNITWLSDWNYAQTSNYAAFGRMTQPDAHDWAQALLYGGYDDWRLPSTGQPDASCSATHEPGFGFPTQYLGFNCTGSEMGHLFYADLGGNAGESVHDATGDTAQEIANFAMFVNVHSFNYWSGTIPDSFAGLRWTFSMFDGEQDTTGANGSTLRAVAVRPGDVVNQVSAPPTLALLLLLLGLAALARRP